MSVHILKKEEGGNLITTSLDEAVLPRELQMLKAFLPFLPAPAQKMLAIYIKWTELQNTIAYFNQHPPVQKSLDGGNLMEFMKGIVPPEEQAQMEQFADMFEHMDLYQEMFEGFAPKEGDT